MTEEKQEKSEAKDATNAVERDFSRVILTLENVLIPEDKISPSPSISDGLDAETEMDLRILGCELIQTAGILLKLPQVAMATGQVLFQRFYYSKSFVKHNYETLAMACINLASKIEEAPRRIRDVINVFHHVKQVKNGKTISPLVLDSQYLALKNNVIRSERRVLKELGFCVHVKHPHKIIVMFLQVLDSHENAKLVQCAWNYMNDSFRTNVFVQYHPETIGCACIYLAARQLQIPLPNNPAWYSIFDVTEDEILDICLSILKLYARPKPNVEKLEEIASKAKRIQAEAKLKARGLASGGTTPNSGSRAATPLKQGTSPLTLPNVKKIKAEDDKGSDSSVGRDYTNHVAKRRRSRSRSASRSPSQRRSKSRSYSSRSRSGSRSPVEKRKHRDGDSPSRKWKKNAHTKEYKDTHKDYKENYHVSAKEKNRSRKHRRSASFSPSRSRSYSRSPGARNKKKHLKERYRSRSRTPERYSKVERFRSRSRERMLKPKKRNGHHRSRSHDRYRR